MIQSSEVSHYCMFQFLCLRRSKQLNNYLNMFSHYKPTFIECSKKLVKLINDIHSEYLQKYVLRNRKRNFNFNYNLHLNHLHKTMYLPSIKMNSKIIITKTIINTYLFDLSPSIVLTMIQL